uniref:Putative endoribonuclease l-psp n=1 Tax=Amblyomma aureolatum TaxID=187763 RepID=A0A1E1WYT3_9ACAR
MPQTKTVINTPNAPKAIGPYSHAVRVGNTVYVSGQVGSHPGTNKFDAGIVAQTRQTLVNLSNILQAAGMSLDHVVKCTIYLASMDDYKDMNKVYAEFFQKDFPARAAFQVAKLPENSLVEIDAIAVDHTA